MSCNQTTAQPTADSPAKKTLTFAEALQLKSGTTLYHVSHRNADGSAQRWRVNGKVKTWKRDPSRLQIPVKNGLKNCDYLTERDLNLVCLKQEDALDPTEKFYQKFYAKHS